VDERDIGIEAYLTDGPGIGGRIKVAPEDFVVEEIPGPPRAGRVRPATLAVIRARNWETNRLVRELARALRISRRRISFAGTKDKRAVTTRRFLIEAPPDAVLGIRLGDVEVLSAETTDRPLAIGDLAGNRFRVVVRDLVVDPGAASARSEEIAREIRVAGGFPNFFGVQRFGSIRPITHIVGRHIARGEFREAVLAYVANPIEGESPESFAARAELVRTGDCRAALRAFPPVMSFERAMLHHLVERHEDYVGALLRLPTNLLSMFVHGYQSFLFNRILSERILRRIPIGQPVEGDLVLPLGRDELPDRHRTIPVDCTNIEKVASQCARGNGFVSGLLFGSESEFAGGEVGRIEKAVVAAEGLRPEDFVVPAIPWLSSKGGRREIVVRPSDLTFRAEDGSIVFDFSLPRGAYATTLLREFQKLDAPSATAKTL